MASGYDDENKLYLDSYNANNINNLQEEEYDHQYYYEQLLDAGVGVTIKGEGIKLNTDADAGALYSSIQACTNLKYLELEGNSLGIPVAKSIAKLMEAHPEFEVALWKDLFTGRLKDEIPKALQYLFGGVDLSGARLQRLDLSDNAIGPVGMSGLAPFFRTKSSFSLKELVVSNQGLGPEGGTTFAQALIACYNSSLEQGEQPFQLKVFICGRNRLENKAATKFAEFFTLIGSLEEIHLPQNGINPPGIRALAESFKCNPNLRIVNLNDNTIRPDGALDLGQALSTLNYLEELNLGDCLLRNDGVLSILNGIPEKSNTLLSLNFESNEITKHVGRQLAKMLTSFPSILMVQLGYNEFGVQTIDEMNGVLAQYNSSEVQIEFDEDTGSGNENEDDEEQKEGAETWGSFKEGDTTGEGGHEEDYDEEKEQEDNPWHEYGEGQLLAEAAAEASANQDQDYEYNKFMTETSICSPSVTTSSVSFVPPMSNNNLFTFGSSFSFSAPTFGMTSNIFGTSANTANLVAEFVKTPTFPNYMKLTPEPEKKIIAHFEEKYIDKVEFGDNCIVMAFGVANIVGFGIQTQDCFNVLMDAALKSSVNANCFITTVLAHLGLIHAEDKVENKVELVSDATTKALAGFLSQDFAPIVVLRCAQEFFTSNTPAARPNVKILSRDVLLEAVNRQLLLLE